MEKDDKELQNINFTLKNKYDVVMNDDIKKPDDDRFYWGSKYGNVAYDNRYSFNGMFYDSWPFYEKAKSKGLTAEQTKALWHKYLEQKSDAIKKSFVDKAKTRGLSEEKIESLWEQYLIKLKEG